MKWWFRFYFVASLFASLELFWIAEKEVLRLLGLIVSVNTSLLMIGTEVGFAWAKKALKNEA